MNGFRKNILVIKLGALGDVFQALGAMRAIREHHPDDRITLLTMKPFEGIARDCGYIDDIIFDSRPKFYELSKWIKLRKDFADGNFSRVYDLQNNDRTSIYFKMFPAKAKPEWVGTAPGASHRNTSNERTKGHALDGHKQTLALAGVENVELDDLSWIKADVDKFGLPNKYALLVPGCSPSRPEKRWPARYFAEIGSEFLSRGITPVIIGGPSEKDLAEEIKEICPKALDLAGETSLYEIVVLGRKAETAIGNDTGPMHMIAATGCPCYVIFSKYSNPDRHCPKGKDVTPVRKDELENLLPDEVKEIIFS